MCVFVHFFQVVVLDRMLLDFQSIVESQNKINVPFSSSNTSKIADPDSSSESIHSQSNPVTGSIDETSDTSVQPSSPSSADAVQSHAQLPLSFSHRASLLADVYSHFQLESKSPVTNFLRGVLSNTILIQIQKLKCDSIAMLASIDDVMQVCLCNNDTIFGKGYSMQTEESLIKMFTKFKRQ